jgi:hypothetical protein
VDENLVSLVVHSRRFNRLLDMKSASSICYTPNQIPSSSSGTSERYRGVVSSGESSTFNSPNGETLLVSTLTVGTESIRGPWQNLRKVLKLLGLLVQYLTYSDC